MAWLRPQGGLFVADLMKKRSKYACRSGAVNPPNSSQGLDGHRTPMGLEGNETSEKIGEQK